MLYPYDKSGIYEANSEVKVGLESNDENMILCGVLNENEKKTDLLNLTCITDIEGRYIKVFKPENGYALRMKEFKVCGYNKE